MGEYGLQLTLSAATLHASHRNNVFIRLTENADEISPHLFLNLSLKAATNITVTDTCASFEEEEALLSEMDVTGQAFEDMQEQNSRLLQQLREKDDANFKLMSERIKSNQIYKLLKEEKEELADQVLTFKTQVKSF